jgi:hypothetical protein
MTTGLNKKTDRASAGAFCSPLAARRSPRPSLIGNEMHSRGVSNA